MNALSKSFEERAEYPTSKRVIVDDLEQGEARREIREIAHVAVADRSGVEREVGDPAERGHVYIREPVFEHGLVEHAQLRQRLGRMRLDLEPDAEAGLRLPDLGHFFAGVARDHRRAFREGLRRRINKSRGFVRVRISR